LLKKSKNKHLLSKNDEKQESSGHYKITPEMQMTMKWKSVSERHGTEKREKTQYFISYFRKALTRNGWIEVDNGNLADAK
jgi:hypothetical protein